MTDQTTTTGARHPLDKTVLVTVGWTQSDRGPGGSGYSSFDGWVPGARQVTRTITFDVPYDYTDAHVCWTLLEATNAPATRPGSPAAAAAAAIVATGYRGEGAHYSLSKGDTVTVHHTEAGADGPSTRYAFTGYDVEAVEHLNGATPAVAP